MAKKTKRSQARRRQQLQPRPGPATGPFPAATAAPTAEAEPASPVDLPVDSPSAAAPPQPSAVVRRVGRIDPATQRAAARQSSRQSAITIAPLDTDDAAIPFDRVPYVPGDLRRVAIIAVVMVFLIIIADLVVTHVT
jgi:hypothetical protein